MKYMCYSELQYVSGLEKGPPLCRGRIWAAAVGQRVHNHCEHGHDVYRACKV